MKLSNSKRSEVINDIMEKSMMHFRTRKLMISRHDEARKKLLQNFTHSYYLHIILIIKNIKYCCTKFPIISNINIMIIHPI